jgi:hypothetical protein
MMYLHDRSAIATRARQTTEHDRNARLPVSVGEMNKSRCRRYSEDGSHGFCGRIRQCVTSGAVICSVVFSTVTLSGFLPWDSLSGDAWTVVAGAPGDRRIQ